MAMAAGVNVLKVATNVFRGRLAFIHELSDVYYPSITKSKDKLVELIKDKTNVARKSELAQKLRVAKGFYTLEMAPPTSDAEIKRLRDDFNLVKDFMKTGCYKYITVKQAWLLFLMCTEVGLWFYLGETIGKMHIVGYLV